MALAYRVVRDWWHDRALAFGVAAHIWYQSRTLDEMSDAEYEAKVDNAEADWRRYGTRYATIAEVETGAYRSR